MILFNLLLAAAVHAADAPKPVDGKAIYGAKCATCHGKDGSGSASMAKMFKVESAKLNLASGDAVKETDESLTKIATDGKDKMPAFKGKLKEAEISAVIGYVRSLQKPAEKPAEKKP